MPKEPFSQTSLSPETRAWLAAQANNQFDEPQFSAEDVVKIPRKNGQFDLFIVNRNEEVGSGSVSQIYKAYPISVAGVVTREPVAVKVMPSEGYGLDLMSSRPETPKDCNLFLMKTPSSGEFKKSNKSNLYLYKKPGCDVYLRKTPVPPKSAEESTRTSLNLYKDNTGIFYMSGGKRFTIENPPAELKNDAVFNDTQCKIPEVSHAVIETAAKNNHVRTKEKYFYLWGGAVHYIEDTKDITKLLRTANFNNLVNTDKKLGPLIRITHARGHTYSQAKPSDEKVIKFKTTDTGIQYQMKDGEKLLKGFIPWSNDFPKTTEKNILANKDQWLPMILAKMEKEDPSEDYDKRIAAVEGLDRESISLNAMGKVNGRATTVTGDYLFMPLSSGKPMDEPTSAFKDVKTLKDKTSIMSQLSAQLQLLHTGGRTHGDLHPGNMLLSQDSNKNFRLDLIDFDQSRNIKNKNEILSPGIVNMAPQIRAPEILEQKVGAPSDIYALGLNFLFILGHKQAFHQIPPTKYFMEHKNESPEYQAALKAYDPQKHGTKAQYEKSLVKQGIADAYVEQEWRKEHPIVIGELKSLPLLVDDIPIRQLVQEFLHKMLSETATDRPTIDEVNQFMKAFHHLINNPAAKIVNESSLAKWQQPLDAAQLKQYHDKLLEQLPKSSKENAATPNLNKPLPTQAANDNNQELYRAKLATLLEGMKNIDSRINKQKGIVGRIFFGKSPDRIQLENTLKGIAGLYDAASSKDPKKDYEQVKKYVVDEKMKVELLEGKSKLGALKSILKDAAKAHPKAETLAPKEESRVKHFFRRSF